jgi:pyridoxamine 5'-phosphate oxidase
MSSNPLYQEAVATVRSLLDEATRAGEPEPTAMTLATADANGRVAARIVLCKGIDERGVMFVSNYDSAKARQLAAHPQAALVLLWKTLRDGVQVRIEGAVDKVDDGDSDVYFASRLRASQVGAWASLQSQTLAARDELDARVAEFERRFEGGPVPRPPNWGGYRLVPDLIEIWYGQRARLHDRVCYERDGGNWTRRLLYP